jgi:hypothetical protein
VKNASRIVSEQVDLKIEALCEAATKNDAHLIVFLLEQLVPEYMPDYSAIDGQASDLKSNSNTGGSMPKNSLTCRTNPPLNQLPITH